MPPDDYYKSMSPLAAAHNSTGPAKPGALDPALQGVTTAGGGQWMRDQYNQLGPQLVKSVEAMPGALEAAYAAKDKAYNDQIGYSQDYIGGLQKPSQNDMWGAFGVGMLKPTSTGSFAEGLGNAFGAAMDARNSFRDKESERRDKLYRSQMALADLQAGRPNAEVDRLERTIGVADAVNRVGGITADMQLGNGPTPDGDEALVADYRANPNKYAGERGRAMVQEASERLKAQAGREWELQKMAAQGEIDIAKEAAKKRLGGNDLTNVDKKAYLEAQQQNGAFVSAKRVLERAKELGPQTYSGIAPDSRAWLNSNFGIGLNSTEDANAHIEYQKIMTGEAIKQMSEQLKGASTDYEMNKFIDMIADPTLPWEAKEPIVDRVLNWIETESAVNSDLMNSLDPQNRLYGGDPQARSKRTSGGGAMPNLGDTVDDISGLPDGIQIQDESGQTYVIRNGQPEPVQQ